MRLPRVDLEAALGAVIENVFAHTPEHAPFVVNLLQSEVDESG
jgi:hypothetical protein